MLKDASTYLYQEQENFDMPHFDDNPRSFFAPFSENTHLLQTFLTKNTPQIDEIVENFLKNNSTYATSLEKYLARIRLSAEERRFILKPLSVKYTDNNEMHQLYKIVQNKEINHSFVRPEGAVEGHYYRYFLYIPIPRDLLKTDPETLLKEHWNLIFDEVDKKFKDIITQFKPVYTISRVYGWEGSWLTYLVSVKDTEDFWSLPLTDTSFNGSQPFLAVKDGEFTIIEGDSTLESIEEIDYAINKIKDRVGNGDSLEFEEGKSIEITPEWMVAHNILSKEIGTNVFKDRSKELGSRLGSASIKGSLPESTEELLSYMINNIMGKPQYMFRREEIKRCNLNY